MESLRCVYYLFPTTIRTYFEPQRGLWKSIYAVSDYSTTQRGLLILNERMGQSEIIDIPSIVEARPEKWYNTTLSQVNDSLVRLGIFEGEFHWHHHDNEDEFFYVISGRLLLDSEDGTIELGQNQAYTVPKGIEHRTGQKRRLSFS
jgi:mannose-6-phosphate isomerase-like protein (cupin superfamily)